MYKFTCTILFPSQVHILDDVMYYIHAHNVSRCVLNRLHQVCKATSSFFSALHKLFIRFGPRGLLDMRCALSVQTDVCKVLKFGLNGEDNVVKISGFPPYLTNNVYEDTLDVESVPATTGLKIDVLWTILASNESSNDIPERGKETFSSRERS